MTLTFFCRLAADFSLYYAFANCILLFFSPLSGAAYIGPIAILLAAGVLSFRLKSNVGRKPLAAAPLLLPILVPVFLRGWLPFLAVIPPWAYLVYLVYLDLEQLSYTEYHDRFFLGLKLLPLLLLPLIFSLNSNILPLFQTRILPFVIFFMFCSVLSLRLSRYSLETLKQKSAQLANILLLICFILICLSVVYSNIWVLIGQFFALLYRYLLAPVILLLALIITLPFFALSLLLKLFTGEPQADDDFFTMELGEFIDSGLETYSTLQMPAFLRYAFIGLLTAGLLFAVWRLFRRLASRDVRKVAGSAISEKRQKLDAGAGRDIDLLPPSDPRHAIRYYYRRFIRQCRKHGLPAGPNQTSRDIGVGAARLLHNKEKVPAAGNLSFSENISTDGNLHADAFASLDGLRALYLPARYDDSGNALFDRKDAVKARSHYYTITRAFNTKSAAPPQALPPDEQA